MILSKQIPSDLAFFGSQPLFEKPVHVGRPNVGNRDRFLAYANEILDSRWLTNNGHYVRELEERLAALLGVPYVVLVNNGTTGLLLAMKALDLNGEVIVPSFTFVATVHALQWMGLKPVFCDVDPLTHNLDPQQVETLITPQTSAILGVHLWGTPCDVVALTAIAKRHGLKLVFDAAHAFCSQLDGTYIGNFGDAEIFSFHATKFFNTFEGGAITTHDLRLAEKLRLMRNFGFSGEDTVVELGINGKMNELSAAMGLTLLPDLPELLDALQRNHALYEEMLEGLPGLRLLRRTDRVDNNCQYVVIELNGNGIRRDLAYEILRAENIRARRYFYPGSHRMEPYCSQPDLGPWRLPVTERLVDEILCLPNNASMAPEDARKIGELLRYIVVNGKQIEKWAASEGFALG